MRIDATTRALLTGATRGIGRELAGALAPRGAAIGLLARSADEALARELGPRAVALPADKDALHGWYRGGERAAARRIGGAAAGLSVVVAPADVDGGH